MKKNTFLKYFLLASLVAVVFTACRKVPEADKTTDTNTAGASFIGFPGGMEQPLFFSPFTTKRNIDAFTIKRDAANSDELQNQKTVQLTAIPDAIDKFNEDNDETFELLPTDLYTIVNKDFTATSNGLTVNFKPGDFAKDFTISLDGSKWDVSHKYAIAYQISNADGLTVHAASTDTLLVFFSVKNKYDGIYEVTGTMEDKGNANLVHPTNGLTDDDGPLEYELRTIAPNKCALFDRTVTHGINVPIFDSGAGSFSYYGSFGLIFEFDLATDKIVSVSNYYGLPANTRSAGLDPSGENTYDASAKTMNVKYRMYQPSVIVDAPHIRVTWDESWKYVGER